MRETDQITDAPTIELLEDVVRRTRRHIAWGDEVLERLCDTEAKRERRRRRVATLRAQLEACGGVTGTLADEEGRAHCMPDARAAEVFDARSPRAPAGERESGRDCPPFSARASSRSRPACCAPSSTCATSC